MAPQNPTATTRSKVALARRLRQAAVLLLLLYFTGLIVSLLPLSLADSGWYLTANDRLIANAPIIVTAAGLWWLAMGLSPLPTVELKRPLSLRARLNPLSLLLLDAGQITPRLCRMLFVVYLLVLPSELIAGLHQALRIQAEYAAGLGRYQQQNARLNQGLQTATTPAQLEALLAPAARQTAPLVPLEQRRQSLRRALVAEQAQLVQSLAKDRRRRLTRLLIDMLRVIAVTLPISLFFRGLSRPDGSILDQVEAYRYKP